MAKIPALPHVRSSITQGLSANKAYNDYQETARTEGATGMRRQDYLRLYSQTRALRGQAADLLDSPKDLIHGGVDPVQRDTINAKGYGYWVAAYMRTKGESDFMSRPFLIKSHAPITAAEAERRAGQFLANSDHEYDRTIIGVGLVGVEQFNPTRG